MRRVFHFHRCSVLLLLSAVLLVWVDLPLVRAAALTSGVDGELDAGGPANAESDHADSSSETWAGRLYSRAKDSVVMVSAGASEGTGFVFLTSDLVATAFHVIQGEVAPTVTLSDGTELPARVVAWDEQWDLALLKLPRPTKAEPLQIIGEGQTRVGDPVATIGNPWGAEQRKLPDSTAPVWALSHGIVSAPPGDLIQTDAPVNPGNSGGPLLTSGGRVIGVLVVRVEGSDGISFAVGSKHLIALAARLGQQDTYAITELRIDQEVYWLPVAEHSLNGLALGLRVAHRSRFGVAVRGGRQWGSRVVQSMLEHDSRNRWLLETEVGYYLIDSPGLSALVGVGFTAQWDSVRTYTIALANTTLGEQVRESTHSSLRGLLSLGLDTSLVSLHTGVYVLGGDTGARLGVGFVF